MYISLCIAYIGFMLLSFDYATKEWWNEGSNYDVPGKLSTGEIIWFSLVWPVSWLAIGVITIAERLIDKVYPPKAKLEEYMRKIKNG